MATIEDMMRHLEEDPDDHKERWRLAKRLYMQCEYRQALEHLQQLKEQWQKKLNVSRYLGATYYRLGLYEEAIRELEEAIAEWPEEIALQEQLARVHEVAGQRSEAAEVWKRVASAKPDHPIAPRAIHRLEQAPDGSAKDDLHLQDSDSGIDLAPLLVCAACGAQNSKEYERCWQCQTALEPEPTPSPMSFAEAPPAAFAKFQRLIFGLLGAAVLAGSVFFLFQNIAPVLLTGGEPLAAESPKEAIDHHLALPRAATGLALALVWPLCMMAGLNAVKLQLWPTGQPWLFGFFLAGLAFLSLFVPYAILPFAVGGVLVAGVLCTPMLFPLSLGRALLAGMLHTIPAALIGTIVFVVLAGIEPISEYRAITRYLAGEPQRTEHVSMAEASGETAFTFEHRFGSTGNSWMDTIAGSAVFEISADVTEPPLVIQFRNESELLTVRDVTSPTVRFGASVEPHQLYRLIVSGQEGVEVTVRGRCALGFETDS